MKKIVTLTMVVIMLLSIFTPHVSAKDISSTGYISDGINNANSCIESEDYAKAVQICNDMLNSNYYINDSTEKKIYKILEKAEKGLAVSKIENSIQGAWHVLADCINWQDQNTAEYIEFFEDGICVFRGLEANDGLYSINGNIIECEYKGIRKKLYLEYTGENIIYGLCNDEQGMCCSYIKCTDVSEEIIKANEYLNEGQRNNAVNLCEQALRNPHISFRDKVTLSNIKNQAENNSFSPESVKVMHTYENVAVYIEGEKIEFDVQPQIINGRTMVPMRKIFEQLGATVEWEEETQTITGIKEGTSIIMKIDNNELSVNGNVSTLDVAPIVIDGRTLVPVRAIAESFGVDVLWYGDIETVAIYRDKELIEKKNLYNLKGDSVEIDTNFEDKYISLGWSSDISEIEMVCMYAPDGITKYVHIGDVSEEVAVGWYTEPVVIMYALDGRTQVVKISDVEANKSVGWYETKEEVTQNVYSITGAKEVYKAEVESYLQQGWRAYPYPITLSDQCSYEENSVNGIKLYWRPQNSSGKTINYYTVRVYYYNPVGDFAYDDITGKPYDVVKYVGPVQPNGDLIIYDIVGYVSACKWVVIGEVLLEYADGTTEEIWCGQAASEGDIFSKWNGMIIPKPY